MRFSIAEIEEKYSLFDDLILDFHYWPYIRMTIEEQIHISSGNCENNNNRSRIGEIKDVLGLAIHCMGYLCSLKRIKKKDILFITHPRRLYEDGVYKCLYTDELSKHYLKICNVAEFVYGSKHLEPVAEKEIIYLDWIDVKPAIVYQCRFIFPDRKLRRICKEKAEILHNIINKEFSVRLNTNDLKELLYKRYVYYKVKKRLLKKFLERSSPKLIIEVVAYETNKMVLNEIAKEKNIITIELQHGVMGRGHLAYNYLKNDTLPSLPDKMFLYGGYWKQTCHYPIGDNNMLVTGFPYNEKQRKKFPKKNKNCTVIIVLSEGIYTHKILEFTLEALALLTQRNNDFELIYKLHPFEFQMPLKIWSPLAKYPQVKLVNTPDVSLYSLFAESDILLGIDSTSVFEGLSYGMEAYLIHCPGADIYMKDLIENHFVTVCETAQDFVVHIENRKREKIECKPEFFFERNAIKKMRMEIDQLLKETKGGRDVK